MTHQHETDWEAVKIAAHPPMDQWTFWTRDRALLAGSLVLVLAAAIIALR